MYFVLLGEWHPPEYVIHTRGKTFNLTRGKQVLKHAESHRCQVNSLGKLACNFKLIFQAFSEGFF